jgi:hypothetical protein
LILIDGVQHVIQISARFNKASLATMPINTSLERVSLWPHVLQFAGIFALLSIAVSLFFGLIGYDAPSAMGIITVMVSLSPVGASFVKKYGRVMTTGERALFAVLALVATFAVTLVMLVVFLMLAGLPVSMQGFGQVVDIPAIGGDVFAYIMLGVAVLYWLIIFFGMIFACRTGMKQLERQQAK